MAGRGPAPKDKSERRNRAVKGRGEWIDLPAENDNDAPSLPMPAPYGGWNDRTERSWKTWWRDPVSLLWEPADLDLVEQLIYLKADLDGGKVTVASEIRLRMDGLGLTQNGKRNLRWRIATDEVANQRDTPDAATPSRYDHLRAVSSDG